MFFRFAFYLKAKKDPKWITDRNYYNIFGKPINYDNPSDLNEKIHWLKFYSDTSQWSRLADKYKVREYVIEKGLEHMLRRLCSCH
ncbi:MAG: hypothetical protein LBF08_05205 [Dysgonamonadaceae bacterium]|jgi:hypothetical protein|nr:hypothetical protein [Dysgonamonadaceae bacterium]